SQVLGFGAEVAGDPLTWGGGLLGRGVSALSRALGRTGRAGRLAPAAEAVGWGGDPTEVLDLLAGRPRPGGPTPATTEDAGRIGARSDPEILAKTLAGPGESGPARGGLQAGEAGLGASFEGPPGVAEPIPLRPPALTERNLDEHLDRLYG